MSDCPPFFRLLIRLIAQNYKGGAPSTPGLVERERQDLKQASPDPAAYTHIGSAKKEAVKWLCLEPNTHTGRVWMHTGNVGPHTGHVWMHMGHVGSHTGLVCKYTGRVRLHTGTFGRTQGVCASCGAPSSRTRGNRVTLRAMVYPTPEGESLCSPQKWVPLTRYIRGSFHSKLSPLKGLRGDCHLLVHLSVNEVQTGINWRKSHNPSHLWPKSR